MPASYLMSWEPTRRRWWKMYLGKRYVVSCRQLDAVRETKEESYQLANLWWKSKKLEIDSQHPNAARILEQRRRIEWAQRHHREDLIQKLRDLIVKLENDVGSEPAKSRSPLAHLCTEDGEKIYHQISESLREIYEKSASSSAAVIERVIDERIWDDRLSRELEKPTVVNQDRSVANQVDLWIENLRLLANAGQYGHGELRGQTSYIKHFVSFLGAETSIDAINEEMWASFHRHLLNQIGDATFKPEYAKKLHRSARMFVEHLVSLKRIPAPGNLLDKRMRFTVPKQKIEVFQDEEIARLLDESRDTIRLMILLALNTGMTQIDISDLSHDEVDWERGRLTRKRSKTADRANVPTVEYPLWEETFTLLTRLRSSDPDRVLVTQSGRPWVCRRETNIDSIRIEFEKLKPALSFKYLRKTAATKLGSHPEYRAYAQHFLGHAPSNVADSHYVRPDQPIFDLAIRWLREQLLL